MVCENECLITLSFSTQKRKFVAEWASRAGIYNRFYLSLYQSFLPGVPTAQLLEERNIFASARQYTFKYHAAQPGQKFYVCISPRCLSCERAEERCSPVITV